MISTPVFANSSAGADYVGSNGEWLNIPDAVLISNQGSSNQAILLSLQNPMYNDDDEVSALSPSGSSATSLEPQHVSTEPPLSLLCTPCHAHWLRKSFWLVEHFGFPTLGQSTCPCAGKLYMPQWLIPLHCCHLWKP